MNLPIMLTAGVAPVPQDKYAVLGPGDNLGRLAKQNGTTVADIAKWNGVRDTRQLGVGVRLIVAKGLPVVAVRAVNALTKVCRTHRHLCVHGEDAALPRAISIYLWLKGAHELLAKAKHTLLQELIGKPACRRVAERAVHTTCLPHSHQSHGLQHPRKRVDIQQGLQTVVLSAATT